MNYSLAEAPSGLVHHIRVSGSGRAVTACGREVDWDRWTRIRTLDAAMQGKGKRTVAAMIELPKCDRCFSR